MQVSHAEPEPPRKANQKDDAVCRTWPSVMGAAHARPSALTVSRVDVSGCGCPAMTTLLEKRDPHGWQWRQRHFAIDECRGAVVYTGDAAQTAFKGALPLEMVCAVEKVGACGLSIRIEGRTFALRARDEVGRDAFVTELKEAMADPNPSRRPDLNPSA